ELDQKPRATYRAQPVISSALRKRAPATVHVMFIVDERGRVNKPKVKKSTDPAFDRAAITAIKKWKFEPAKKDGKPVSKKMVVPITFPKGS
ncbi:MAG: energy transducer TonB, partial [Planctomycetota bacterium]|nr:energy transducer TonB [Planctomycetota bacterium]